MIIFCIRFVNAQIQDTTVIKADTMIDNSIDDIVKANARDSIVYFPQSNVTIMYGKSNVEYQTMKITAAIIEMDNQNKTLMAYGVKNDTTGKLMDTPIFSEGNTKMEAEKIAYNMESKKGKIWNAYTTESNMLVYGQEIKKDDKDVMYMKNLNCIPCDYKDAKTYFVATKAKIIPNDKIITGPMYLKIGNIPTPLFLPFGFFPNTKKSTSGFLMPFIGNSPTQGFFLKDGGMYLAINQKTDLFLRGDVYSNGSWGVRAINNYISLYRFRGSVMFGYSEYFTGDRDIPSQNHPQKSFNVQWKHFQDSKLNPGVRISADVNYNNNKFNKYNAINSGQYLNNVFMSNVSFSKTLPFGLVSVNAMHSQNSQNSYAEITLPQFALNVNRFFPFNLNGTKKPNILTKTGISYVLEAKNTLVGTDTTLFKTQTLEQRMRNGVRQTLPISTSFNILKNITVSPGANFSMVSYAKKINRYFDASNNLKTDTIQQFVNGFDMNFNTSVSFKVYTDFFFKKGKTQQIRYMLIPTFSYMYRPDIAKDLSYQKQYQDNVGHTYYYSIFETGIYGGPTIGKQNGVSFNFNNNIEAKVKTKTDTGFVYKKKTLLQNLGISGNYNFAADSFRLSYINFSARNKIWKFFDFLANATADPYYYDKTSNYRTSKYLYQQENKLARFTQMNFAVNGAFSSDILAAMNATRQPPQYTNAAENGAAPTSLPWSLNFNYNININLMNPNQKQTTQTFNFSGSWSMTKFWKFGITSGYDFINKQLSYTSINIYRDLKCWEARIQWIPFGFRKSYSITINLKNSMFSEFKIPRQRQWFDNL